MKLTWSFPSLFIGLLIQTVWIYGQTQNELNHKSYALFVVGSEYDSLDRLKYTKIKALEIANVLKSSYGFEIDTLFNPTLEKLTQVLETYEEDFQRGKRDSTGQLFLFFSGHGTKGFFFTKNSSLSKAKETALEYSKWRPRIANLECKHILMIIDVCYSGTLVDSISENKPEGFPQISSQSNGQSTREKMILKYFRDRHRKYVTSVNKTASPENSLFTKKLIEGLKEGGGKDALLTSTELITYLENDPNITSGNFEGLDTVSPFIFFNRMLMNKCFFPDAVLVKGGLFQMGDVFSDHKLKIEKLKDSITLKSFWIAKTEVTFKDYDYFCTVTNKIKSKDENWGRGDRPVINVDWYDAIEYCNWRSKSEKKDTVYQIDKKNKDPNNTSIGDLKKWTVKINTDACGYRLPTEAEWEFAARDMGDIKRFGNGTNTAKLEEINFRPFKGKTKYSSPLGTPKDQTVQVGTTLPNALGLYDMSGNVAEWCFDAFVEILKRKKDNPIYEFNSKGRVYRGGSYDSFPKDIRTSARDFGIADVPTKTVGFRLAMSVIE